MPSCGIWNDKDTLAGKVPEIRSFKLVQDFTFYNVKFEKVNMSIEDYAYKVVFGIKNYMKCKINTEDVTGAVHLHCYGD